MYQSFYQRCYQRRQQNRNRINSNRTGYRRYQRRVRPNQDTLNRITSLPQQLSDNLLIYEFFNGSPFSG